MSKKILFLQESGSNSKEVDIIEDVKLLLKRLSLGEVMLFIGPLTEVEMRDSVESESSQERRLLSLQSSRSNSESSSDVVYLKLSRNSSIWVSMRCGGA